MGMLIVYTKLQNRQWSVQNFVAMSDWADPNQRCAAITIALALLVCPEQVSLSKPRDSRASKANVLAAFYKTVEVQLPQKGAKFTNGSFYVKRKGLGWGNDCPSPLVLENLAVSYQDAERNKECLTHLRQYFDVNGSQVEKAAVLGLAWYKLQRRYMEIRQSLNLLEGYFMSCDDPEFGVCTSDPDDKVVKARFKGL